jgi:mannose-6-phosphate isomerase-like protein (cupin superfamily)
MTQTPSGYLTTQESVLAMGPAFRRVLATGAHSQLVAMTLQPHEEIGAEVHEHGDQLFLVIAGWPVVVMLGDEEHDASPGTVVLVPAGVRHNVVNRGDIPATLLTIYAPPEHEDGFVAATKEDAAHEHDH